MERIIQITAGRGPVECAWVVAKVLKYIMADAREQQLNPTVLQKENGHENGTVQSVSIRLNGAHVNLFLKAWLGTVQWIGSSTFRKMHKRKNWFIGIFELEGHTSSDFRENDVVFQAIRSSGPGGQHVNKVSSAIRATHRPTGISVLAMDRRSQHQNKKLALERLAQKVAAQHIEQLQEQLHRAWGNHSNLNRGNPIRVFKGTDFKHQKEKRSYQAIRKKIKNDLKREQWD